MDTRKETLSTLKVCRFCLATDEKLIPLYDNKVRAPKNSVPFALKILACIAIEIFPSDNMPQYICQRCKLFMELSYAFKQLCRQTDEAILQFVQTGTPLTPMPWPAQLSKVYKATNKSEVNVMKTVVQGGATVKVMAEEVSDSEEGEDDNVYNVKIEDGPEEGKSIKVITSINKQDSSSKRGRQGTAKKFPSVSKLTRHVREHAGVRPYPCKHCDKSFTKSHHYTRHLRLKHNTSISPGAGAGGPYAAADAYRCDECEDTFATQDELMYHSALHATTNLVCPLCQEKFDDVDTVTAHIKSHVNGTEFMCDFCELIFTTKEKLEGHIARAHDDELLANDQETENDESSMDMEAEEDDDDNSINVKEEDGHMVVEIKKAGEYLLPTAAQRDDEDKTDNTQSEDSDATYTDSPVTEMEPMPTHKLETIVANRQNAVITKNPDASKAPRVIKPVEPMDIQMRINPTNILRKAEEIKRKAIAQQQQQQQQQQQPLVSAADKKEKVMKIESASDKSLRLLEKELQDLKRTNTRAEPSKTPVRTVESLRNRRPQLYSSTPKLRPSDKKEVATPRQTQEKPSPAEKKIERKVTKDPKEPREAKSNNNSLKEDKEFKVTVKEEKEDKKEVKEDKKEVKEDKKEVKEIPKVFMKNGASEPPAPAAEDTVRRSTRPSKIRDYAKMIRDSSLNSDDNDSDLNEAELEEYKEPEKTPETSRVRGRRGSNKQATPGKAAAPAPPAPATPAAAPRKRGRPRKETPQAVVPSKIKKDEPSEEETDAEPAKAETRAAPAAPETPAAPAAPPARAALVARDSPPKEDEPKDIEAENIAEGTKTPESNKPPSEPKSGVIISPSGQTLKKVPIKALPPGVKPLPLPVNSRLGGGEVCEMQIGKKMVKVQKIVMTKAEVEAMAKKGLVEMKDGTMVLKQGIKLPSADPAVLKNTLVGEEQKKESQKVQDKATPSRFDIPEA